MDHKLVLEVEEFFWGGEFSRRRILQALQRCDSDVDEAVALLLDEADGQSPVVIVVQIQSIICF